VLIPRPETEELVESVVAELKHEKHTVLDVGTGSGCIAIALKKKLPDLETYALDISTKALNIAKKNAAINNTEIQFLAADILNFDSKRNVAKFDVIVSNPPYVKASESQEMLPNVLLYEPKAALFVPDNDALIFYNATADFSLQHFNNGKGK